MCGVGHVACGLVMRWVQCAMMSCVCPKCDGQMRIIAFDCEWRASCALLLMACGVCVACSLVDVA